MIGPLFFSIRVGLWAFQRAEFKVIFHRCFFHKMAKTRIFTSKMRAFRLNFQAEGPIFSL